jgi:putative transposase
MRARRRRRIKQQIAFALQQAESGTQVAEVCRKVGIAETSARGVGANAALANKLTRCAAHRSCGIALPLRADFSTESNAEHGKPSRSVDSAQPICSQSSGQAMS